MTAIRILFAGAFVWFFCLAAGQLFFRAIRLALRSAERTFLGFLTGAMLVSSMMFVLASCRLAYTNLFVPVGLATIAVWVWLCRPSLRRSPDEAPLPPVWHYAFWIPLIVYGYVYLTAAMMPETSPDGVVYHLGLITRYYDHRGFMPMPYYMDAGLPEGIEMLFWIGFALGRHSAAAVVHLLFLFSMPFGMLSFARRAGQPKAGVVAALLFCLAPIVAKDATVAYVDTGTAVVIFGAFYCLWLWNNANLKAALIPAGLLAGYCYACKMPAGIAIPFAVLYVIAVTARRGGGWFGALRSGAFAGLLACLVAVPWMVKSLILFHDPFYPLMNRLFPNPYLYPMIEDTLRRAFVHFNNVPYRQFPYEIAIGGKMVGILGPAFLLAPVALLSLRFPAGRLCLLAFLVYLPPFFGDSDVRFLIPSAVFLALAIGIGLTNIPRAGSALGLAAIAFHVYTAWPGVVQRFFPGYQWRVDVVDLRAALRIVPETKWFEQYWHEYFAGLMLDRFVPAGDKVFSPSLGQLAYHHRDVIGSFDSALGVRVNGLFMAPSEDTLCKGWRREFRFPAIATRRIRLRTTSGFDNEFRVHELRFSLDGHEIARSPAWRLTASRNPWEAGLAFDNDPVTWWTSGQRIDPETWIEADFPQAVRIDRVSVDQIEDQRWSDLYLSADLNGRWTRLQAQETGISLPRPPDLRMALRDAMKAAGIRWILIRDGDFGSEDLRDKSPYWGITQIAESYGFRLWKLN